MHPKIFSQILFTQISSFSHFCTISLIFLWTSNNHKTAAQIFLAIKYFFIVFFLLLHIILYFLQLTQLEYTLYGLWWKICHNAFSTNKIIINETPKIRIIITKLFSYCPMAVGQWSVYSIVMLNSGFCSNSCDGNKHNKNASP